MLFNRTNVHQKLVRERDRKQDPDSVLSQVYEILNQDHAQEEKIKAALSRLGIGEVNAFDFDQLESERIFHEDTIRTICIDYRLRFLDTYYFKGKIPQEAINAIKKLERDHDMPLSGFKIIAPSKMFVLNKTDDPLMFAPMGNGYFYLIHKWGRDLHPFRKLRMWPFKSFENLIFTILLSSVLTTMMVPDGLFAREQTFSQDIMVFFFMFKSIAAVVLFYGFASGKNFNTAIWQSKFDKAQ
ncbi:hypothetical protein [Flavimarina sp. Hel_I_48]|uniref:hypothetical protein n=1 Tax=Flavimarina sp. Hel_I_48 TaxID=1392488 RepID=UPI0004DF513F|nr:hypothetical protein [Flavimarina sp. Hel_I_48]